MDFYQKMALVCGRIPEGRVATYGQIALLCGKPKNSRKVGFALNRGLSGEKTNAHRVVNRRGILSGAANFETFDMQRLLLEQEGIQVTWTPKGWQVELKRFGWKSTMEDAVMFRKLFEKEGI